ncbi:MAG: YcgN family cysteine cluster protein [Gammaproteobacteria bacterium]
MPAFWEDKTLDEMTPGEWESLCDGCGRCCLHKLEDIDTGRYYYTDVACHLLDESTCRCRKYDNRMELVSDCMVLDIADRSQFDWLPTTCAYRRIAEHKPLEWWHHLVSGDRNTVHEAGISVRGHTSRERDVAHEELEDHIIHWIDF